MQLKKKLQTLEKGILERSKMPHWMKTKLPKIEKEGFVYFIQAINSSFIKIGWAVDPIKRLKNLQTGSSETLIFLGCIRGTLKNEKHFHKLMKECKHLREWYYPNKNLIQFIKERDCSKEYGIQV